MSQSANHQWVDGKWGVYEDIHVIWAYVCMSILIKYFINLMLRFNAEIGNKLSRSHTLIIA